jgi:dCMP deaminase
MTKWDRRFMELAKLVATWSKDRSTKVGCVIVGPDREVRSIGFNGFPRRVDDDIEERHERPAKYAWTEHAERNAIYNAVRIGVPLAGCTIYLPWFPCMDCARALVQVGIVEIVALEPNLEDPKWGQDFKLALLLFEEAGLRVRWFRDSSVEDSTKLWERETESK